MSDSKGKTATRVLAPTAEGTRIGGLTFFAAETAPETTGTVHAIEGNATGWRALCGRPIGRMVDGRFRLDMPVDHEVAIGRDAWRQRVSCIPCRLAMQARMPLIDA